MKTRKTLIAVAIGALIPLGAAVAGENDQYGSKDHAMSMSSSNFKKLDTNKDGKISQAEAASDSSLDFAKCDTNGDGYIDSAEWKAAAKSGSAKPQSQQQSEPRYDQSSPAPSDSTMPNNTEPSSSPQPDTETPRQ